jgi:hypothetical protein
VPADCEPTALPSELHPLFGGKGQKQTRTLVLAGVRRLRCRSDGATHALALSVDVLVAQWIAHQTSDLGVGGSSPPGDLLFRFWRADQKGLELFCHLKQLFQGPKKIDNRGI